MRLSPLSAEDARIMRLIEVNDLLSEQADAEGDPALAEHIAAENRNLERQLAASANTMGAAS